MYWDPLAPASFQQWLRVKQQNVLCCQRAHISKPLLHQNWQHSFQVRICNFPKYFLKVACGCLITLLSALYPLFRISTLGQEKFNFLNKMLSTHKNFQICLWPVETVVKVRTLLNTVNTFNLNINLTTNDFMHSSSKHGFELTGNSCWSSIFLKKHN